MIDKNSPKPLYVQIEEYIREQLANKSWDYGDKIPSENELSAQFGVSRMTIRNVINRLVQEDLLFRIPGKGTYVSKKIMAQALSYAGIREQLEQMGYEVSTKLLSVEREVGSARLCKIFNARTGTVFIKINRLRMLKGEPLSIHTSYIPLSLCPNLDETELENNQLCTILNNEYGLSRSRVVETLTSIAAREDEAELLEIPVGYPLTLLEDSIYDSDDRVFEYGKVVFRGDRITIKLSF